MRHKGYPELLRAMESVPENARLWVVGERLASDHGEDMEPHFARAAAALGPRLQRLGYRHDVARLLAAADVFCLPSHFEGLPMSVIEAMLTGLPVVATDIRGPREQVVGGETGLLVPVEQMTEAPFEPVDADKFARELAAAINELMLDEPRRRKMAEASRRRVEEQFSWSAIAKKTADLYGEACAGRENGAP